MEEMDKYAKTDCKVRIINNTDRNITIDIDDYNDLDWMDGPKTVLNGQPITNNCSFEFILRSKDSRTRCWFQMNNKFVNPSNSDDYFYVGMTGIELKTNDGSRQAKREERTEYYTQCNIKVTIKIETPTTGAYSLDIIYDKD
ncbi:hypothetical protein [uncultured Parabacteroides sp.]|uniref:hypothetical protein n=1 Tax=uncultured Parabacteroides sp. TaxID=512312 RepID=UPI0025989A28|nr:hypothetical protein [uncultured Parabacteroides sp.]